MDENTQSEGLTQEASTEENLQEEQAETAEQLEALAKQARVEEEAVNALCAKEIDTILQKYERELSVSMVITRGANIPKVDVVKKR